MLNKMNLLILRMRTHYMNLSNEELIEKMLSNNVLIANIAKEEFIKRDFQDLETSDNILKMIISKLTIEDIWALINTNQNNHFIQLISDRLNEILEYYQANYIEAYAFKINEGQDILKLLK